MTGQSPLSRQTVRRRAISGPSLSIFLTDFGWCGIAGDSGRITDILIGHSDEEGVRQGWISRTPGDSPTAPFRECDWHPELRQRFERYGLGEPVAFDDIEIDLPRGTPFQERVRRLTRAIGYGQTISYGDLAARAGSPGAARAVGSVMASNRFPIVIPCHRVIAAAGKLGGFSAPCGLDLKAKLLALEAEVKSRRR
jgi:methylated-DNA-[protein]-cysteine S-methyltransferase